MIINPVLHGFNPDPSFVRVGDTYYIANSTFEWWPGVRLHQSQDLVHWTLLNSPLTRTSQINMRGIPSSGGVWAPDLSYADGKFWLVYSNIEVVNGAFKDGINYLITADDINGPWSEPIELDRTGFDASLFHDDDGRKYLVQQTWDFRPGHHAFDGITLTEYDPVEHKLLPSTRRTLWRGTDVKIVEGPHLLKKDGYYYLFCAEGGTQYEHQESVARSRSLDALSFEVMPGNPLISNFDTPDFPLQKQGHGQIVETAEGEWYYASLVSRPWWHDWDTRHGVRGWSTLGRETSIQKVEWDSEGWPRIVGGQAGQVDVEQPKDAPHIADSDEFENSGCQHDTFTSPQLGKDWNTLRVPFSEKMGRVGDGKLVLRGQGSLANLFNLSLVARRWQSQNFDAEVSLEFDPTNYMQMAGLTNYYNDFSWSWIFVTFNEKTGKQELQVAVNDRNGYSAPAVSVELPEGVHSVRLRTRVRTQTYAYDYSLDNGSTWNTLVEGLDAAQFSDEYIAASYGGFFTGGFVGLACCDVSGFYREATFTDFLYQER